MLGKSPQVLIAELGEFQAHGVDPLNIGPSGSFPAKKRAQESAHHRHLLNPLF